MARARRVASLSGASFWSLTPAEVDDILREALDEWRARERSAAHNAAMVCASIYNCHRDPKRHPEPFTAEDFLPALPEPPAPPLDDEEVGRKAAAAFRLLASIE